MLDENYSQSFEEPKGRPRWVLPLVIVLIIIVLATAGWFVFKKFSPSQNTKIPEIPALTDTSTTPIVPAVDLFPNDKDRDGIDDTKEKELGLSTRDFDTDGDGVADADEIDIWKTDPKKTDTY